MQVSRLIFAATMLAIIVAISAAAQTPTRTPPPKQASPQTQTPAAAPVPDTRMAFIDTTMFADEKGGIIRYVNAVKTLEREFAPRQAELVNIQTRIKALADEISKLSGSAVVDPKTIQSKQDEGERLQRDLKYKKEQADADFAKRYEEAVGPISTDIGKAIDQFALQRGYTVVFDASKLAPAILTINRALDVTQAFVNEYNSTHPATAPR
jgi:Skp family chaperone for outer membrane proteins